MDVGLIGSPRLFLPRCTTLAFALLLVTATDVRAASASLVEEPDGNAYNFVTHYRVQISARAERVWPILIDLKSWMYEFELATVAGRAGNVGHTLRLYEDQEFLIQVTGVVPNELLAIVNLPTVFEGERVTGVGLFTLHERDGQTEVALTMSRRYVWVGDGDNPLRHQRASSAFGEQTRSMWQARFLGRLKDLVEADAVGR